MKIIETKKGTYHEVEKRDYVRRDYGDYEENVIGACRYRVDPGSRAAADIPGTDRSGQS